MNDINKLVIEFLHSDKYCGSNTELKSECIYSDDRKIFLINCADKKYIYKTIGTSRKSTDEFSIEYDLMTEIFGMTKGKFSMPFPLLLLDDGFLMTACEGEPLKDKYFNSVLRINERKKIFKAFKQSAEWLSGFHSCTLKSSDYHEVLENRRQHLVRMIDSINAIECSDSVSNFMEEILLFFDKVNAKDKVGLCQLHGNFALRNILYNDKSVSLIDFEDSKFDCMYYDLGMFIAEVMNKSIYIINKKYNKCLIDTFLNEYTRLIDLDDDMLNSYILYHLVCAYYDVVNRKTPSNMIKKYALAHKRSYTISIIRSFLSTV